MLKAVLKYLLYPCILLLSGQGLHADQDFNRYSSSKALESPAYDNFGRVQNSLVLMISSVSSDTEKEKDDLSALLVCGDNDDDDEAVSVKKHSADSHCSTSIPSQATGYFFNNSKKISPFNKFFCHTLSYRYLVLQVIRI